MPKTTGTHGRWRTPGRGPTRTQPRRAGLTPPQQIHLDLWVEDFPSAHDRVMSLGAKVLKPAQDSDSADNFQVYADPAGHPFCLCWIEG